jgi:hypothetical protein
MVHVRYEEMVRAPEHDLERVCAFLGVPFEPAMVEYGSQPPSSAPSSRGLGDPVTVARETRPTTGSVKKWAQELAEDPGKLSQARQILDRLLDEDLEAWGYPRRAIEQELDAMTPAGSRKRRRLSRYALERKLLVVLRRNIHQNAFGRLVRRVRFACDVLLR